MGSAEIRVKVRLDSYWRPVLLRIGCSKSPIKATGGLGWTENRHRPEQTAAACVLFLQFLYLLPFEFARKSLRKFQTQSSTWS